MIREQLNPKDALERMKLMMEYDSSKTYTENKKLVEEKELLNEIAPAVLLWLIGGGVALATGTGGAIYGEYSTAEADEKIRMLFQGCDKSDAEQKGLKRKTMSDVEHAQIAGLFRESFAYQIFGTFGGGTDLDILKEALKLLETKGNMGDFCAVREVFGKNQFEEEMISELNTKELGWIIKTAEVLLAKSKPGNVPTKNEETANTEWWIQTFPCLEITDSFEDPIVISTDRYGKTFVGVRFIIEDNLEHFKMDYTGRLFEGDKYLKRKVVCSGNTIKIQHDSTNESIVKKKILSEQGSPEGWKARGDRDGGDSGNNTRRVRTRQSYTPSQELLNSGGVKKFQDWLVQNGFGSELGPKGADGKYGKYTNDAWNKHKDDYINTGGNLFQELPDEIDPSQPY